MEATLKKHIKFLFILLVMTIFHNLNATAQHDNRIFRIAKIEVYPEYLEQYKTALAEHAKIAVKVEPGVSGSAGRL